MIPGVSTACLYPDHTEDALKVLTHGGVGAVEIFFNCYSELKPAFVKELRATADAAGTRVVAVHPFSSFAEGHLFFSGYGRRFDEGLELYRRYFEAMNLLGAEILVFHGNGAKVPMEESLYFYRYNTLLNIAHSHGVELCHENVAYCQGGDPGFLSRLIAQIPTAGLVFDVKQSIRSQNDPFAFADVIGKNVRHLHISDSSLESDCQLPGRGTFHIAEFLAKIQSISSARYAIVEVYRDSYVENSELLSGYLAVAKLIQPVLHNLKKG